MKQFAVVVKLKGKSADEVLAYFRECFPTAVSIGVRVSTPMLAQYQAPKPEKVLDSADKQGV